MMHERPIWLFDAHCLLCSRAVRFLLKHERSDVVRIVSITSSEGRLIAAEHGVDPDDPTTFLFIEAGVAHQASDGVIALIRHMNAPYSLLAIARFVPRGLRDRFYFLIARNRYRWFGRSDQCLVPAPHLRHRFAPEES